MIIFQPNLVIFFIELGYRIFLSTDLPFIHFSAFFFQRRETDVHWNPEYLLENWRWREVGPNVVVQQCWPGPKRSIVLTEIYSKFAKRFIQIAGPKNIQHNVVVLEIFFPLNFDGKCGAKLSKALLRMAGIFHFASLLWSFICPPPEDEEEAKE